MTPDSSVVIAVFAEWNQHHEAAVEALGEARDLVGHVELEAYSVLTRLPEPFRAEPALVVQYLCDDFSGRRMVLDEHAQQKVLKRLAGLSIAGGAVYDAIVAITAEHYGHSLLSCDRRAARTYERVGVEVAYL